MNHQQIKELLGSFVDGELSSDQRQQVERHIKQCSECRDLLNNLIKLDQQVKDAVLKQEIPSDQYFRGLRSAILTQLPYKPEPSWKKYFGFLTKKEISAVAVMTLVLVFVLAIRYVSDNFFEQIKQPQTQQMQTPQYSRFLPPDEMEHSFQIDELPGDQYASSGELSEDSGLEEVEFAPDGITEQEQQDLDYAVTRSAADITGGGELAEGVGGTEETVSEVESVSESTDMVEDRSMEVVAGAVGETTTTLESPASLQTQQSYYQNAEAPDEETTGDILPSQEYTGGYGMEQRDKLDSMVSYNLVMIFGDYLIRRNNRDSTVLNIYLDDQGYITDLSIEDGFDEKKISPDVQELLSNTIGRRFEIDTMQVNDTLLKVKIFVDP
ncbi:MAG: anti-sigma factor family protein [bacterium]